MITSRMHAGLAIPASVHSVAPEAANVILCTQYAELSHHTETTASVWQMNIWDPGSLLTTAAAFRDALPPERKKPW